MGSFLPPPKKKTTTLQHIWKEMGRGEAGWISEAMQHLRSSVGLLMRAMLRMMELRGLTNFGKREQEEEESGGGFGAFCYSLFDLGIWGKKWPRDVVKMRELQFGSLTLLLLLLFFFFFFFNQTRGAGEF